MTASQIIEDPSARPPSEEVFTKEELENPQTFSPDESDPHAITRNEVDEPDTQARTELQEGNVYFIWWVIIISVVAVGYFTSLWM